MSSIDKEVRRWVYLCAYVNVSKCTYVRKNKRLKSAKMIEWKRVWETPWNIQGRLCLKNRAQMIQQKKPCIILCVYWSSLAAVVIIHQLPQKLTILITKLCAYTYTSKVLNVPRTTHVKLCSHVSSYCLEIITPLFSHYIHYIRDVYY